MKTEWLDFLYMLCLWVVLAILAIVLVRYYAQRRVKFFV